MSLVCIARFILPNVMRDASRVMVEPAYAARSGIRSAGTSRSFLHRLNHCQLYIYIEAQEGDIPVLALLVALSPRKKGADEPAEDVTLPAAPPHTAFNIVEEHFVPVRDAILGALLQDRDTAEGRGELDRERVRRDVGRYEVLRSSSARRSKDDCGREVR